MKLTRIPGGRVHPDVWSRGDNHAAPEPCYTTPA